MEHPALAQQRDSNGVLRLQAAGHWQAFTGRHVPPAPQRCRHSVLITKGPRRNNLDKCGVILREPWRLKDLPYAKLLRNKMGSIVCFGSLIATQLASGFFGRQGSLRMTEMR